MVAPRYECTVNMERQNLLFVTAFAEPKGRENMKSYQALVLTHAQALLECHSPSGFTQVAVAKAEEIARSYGYETRRSNKGNLIIHLPGEQQGQKRCLCAHIDTLGLMVRSISADGTLRFTKIGGPTLPTLDGEYCTLFTRDGRAYSGTILCQSAAIHVHKDARTAARDEDTMYLRLDERVKSKEDVLALGISVGDFICYDPKTQVTQSGFLKSRFIDDKGSAACLLTLLAYYHDRAAKPLYDTDVILTVYEEVGHGAAEFDPYDELLAVDMGCIGEDLSCDEYTVSICAKDSGGPYDYEMTTRLVALAKQEGIPYALDVYPMYGSDAGAARGAGNPARSALIGPGVHASHGMERTHVDALVGTMQLCAAYLASKKED